jgi:hypothetical protein
MPVAYRISCILSYVMYLLIRFMFISYFLSLVNCIFLQSNHKYPKQTYFSFFSCSRSESISVLLWVWDWVQTGQRTMHLLWILIDCHRKQSSNWGTKNKDRRELDSALIITYIFNANPWLRKHSHTCCFRPAIFNQNQSPALAYLVEPLTTQRKGSQLCDACRQLGSWDGAQRAQNQIQTDKSQGACNQS